MDNWSLFTWILWVFVIGFITFPLYNLKMFARNSEETQNSNFSDVMSALRDINSTLDDIRSELIGMRDDKIGPDESP
jgi:hypothetical protein